MHDLWKCMQHSSSFLSNVAGTNAATVSITILDFQSTRNQQQVTGSWCRAYSEKLAFSMASRLSCVPNMPSCVGVSFSASCSVMSWGSSAQNMASFGGGDSRRDAQLPLVNIIRTASRDFYWLHLQFLGHVAKNSFATLSVGFPTSCPMASRGWSSLNMASSGIFATIGVAILGVGFQTSYHTLYALSKLVYAKYCVLLRRLASRRWRRFASIVPYGSRVFSSLDLEFWAVARWASVFWLHSEIRYCTMGWACS
jgi:hypothetical protein